MPRHRNQLSPTGAVVMLTFTAERTGAGWEDCNNFITQSKAQATQSHVKSNSKDRVPLRKCQQGMVKEV